MRERASAARGIVVLALLGWLHAGCLAGCKDDGPPKTVSTGEADASCTSSMANCDITNAACRQAVLAITACVRGEKAPPMPKIRSLTQDGFRAELMKDAKDMGLMPSPWDPALAALRLVPQGMSVVDAGIETAVQQTVAFYDTETKMVTIIDSGTTSMNVDGMYTLSHEFTHYLQDRAVDLTKLQKRFVDGYDSSAAIRSLIEGEAVVNSTRVLLRWMNHTPHELDWEGFFDRMQGSLLDGIANDDSPLAAADMALPYSVGGRYIARVWNMYDRQHVTRLFAQPPVALADWLAGYGDGDIAQSLIDPLDCAPPLAPDGFGVYGVDSLGVTGALALLTAAGAQDLTLASRLRGDAIAAYVADGSDASADAPTLVAWRLRFSDATSLRNFQRSVAPLGLTTQVFENELLLTAASSDPENNPLSASMLATCPKLDQLKAIEMSEGIMALHRHLLH